MFELTDERRDELIEKWSQKITRRGLSMPAVFVLEGHKPVAGLAAQATAAFGPVLAGVVNFNSEEFAAFINKRENIELFIQRIEEIEFAKVIEEKRAKKRKKTIRSRAKNIAKIRKARKCGQS